MGIPKEGFVGGCGVECCDAGDASQDNGSKKKKKNEMERKFNFNPVDSAVGVLKERKKEEKKKV